MKSFVKKTAKNLFYGLGLQAYNNAGFSFHHKNLGVYIKNEDKFQLSEYKKMYSEDQLSKKPFFNIGSGSFSHPYWTNIDYVTDWYEGVQSNIINHDLMSLTPLPVNSESAEIIYTSHTIEHISEEAVQYLFNEAYRTLSKGGIFRITTGPDADLDYAALLRKDIHWFYWDLYQDSKGAFPSPLIQSNIAERWLHHVASCLSNLSHTPSSVKFTENQIWEIINNNTMEEALNHFTSLCKYNPSYPADHISWWNYSKIEKYLRNAGFEAILKSGYRQSSSPLMRKSELFDSTHPQISVYVEAIKV